MKPESKKLLKNIFSILVTMAFAWLLFYYIRKNWNDFTNVRLVSVNYLIILGFLGIINLILQGLSLYIIVKPFGINLKWREWLGITTWTLLGNYVLPFGGLGFRAAYLKKVYKFDYTYFVSTLTTLYIIQFLVYTIGGLIGLSSLYISHHILDWKLLSLFLIVMTICAIFIFFSPKLPIINNKLYQRFTNIIHSFYKIKKDRRLMRELTLNTLALFITSTLIFYFTYQALHFQVSLIGAMTVSCFSFYTLLIRITPAAFGIYEATVIYSARLLNLSIADGLVIAAVTRLVSLIWILLLGPVFGYILFYKRKNQSIKIDAPPSPRRQICSRCVLDASIPWITFDYKGECNYCRIHEAMDRQLPLNQKTAIALKKIIAEIKAKGKGRKYDCLVGLSGGVDSTYCLYLAKKFGLRPLALHLDNNWNSQIAEANIKNACQRLNVDLRIEKVDWAEFRDIQLAFMKASVPEIEVPTDLALRPTLCRVAKEENITYIINGQNFRTEGKIPIPWAYADNRYFNAIYKKFGSKKKIKNYPYFTLIDILYYGLVRKIKTVRILQYIDYRKDETKKILHKEVGWQDYGGKHYESIYTRLSESYILPRKFHIDKRKIHLAAEVRSGHLSRRRAFAQLAQPPITPDQASKDKRYVLKKLGLSEKEFEWIMSQPPQSFLDYPSYFPLVKKYSYLFKPLLRLLEVTTPQLLFVANFTAPAKKAEAKEVNQSHTQIKG